MSISEIHRKIYILKSTIRSLKSLEKSTKGNIGYYTNHSKELSKWSYAFQTHYNFKPQKSECVFVIGTDGKFYGKYLQNLIDKLENINLPIMIFGKSFKKYTKKDIYPLNDVWKFAKIYNSITVIPEIINETTIYNLPITTINDPIKSSSIHKLLNNYNNSIHISNAIVACERHRMGILKGACDNIEEILRNRQLLLTTTIDNITTEEIIDQSNKY